MMRRLRDRGNRAMVVNALAALVMLVGKLLAYLMTGSAAIFSDWAESCMHLFSTGITCFCFWYAQRPPDHNHPYGHEKIVYFSAASEGLFLLFAALSVVAVAIKALSSGAAPQELEQGIAILVLLLVVNGLLGRYLVREGEQLHHRVLISSGRHLLADMWTTAGIVAGVGLVSLTGWFWLDPLIALLVAAHLFWTAGSLIKDAFEGLMEKSDAQTESLITEELLEAVKAGQICGYHALTHRQINDRIWIEVHLTFPEQLPLYDVHARACGLEMRIEGRFPGRRVWLTTHFEPEEHDEHHPPEHFELSASTRS